MAHIITNQPFDMDQLAALFPGQLKFLGTSSNIPGDTEIIGDVDQDQLIIALDHCYLAPDSTITPITVTESTRVTPDPPIFPASYYPISPTTLRFACAILFALTIALQASTALILHWLGAY